MRMAMMTANPTTRPAIRPVLGLLLLELEAAASFEGKALVEVLDAMMVVRGETEKEVTEACRMWVEERRSAVPVEGDITSTEVESSFTIC
jgi:hypothetical protein